MASPQCENGYTKIANEIVRHLCRYRIPGEEMQTVWAIMHKTWGFQKKQDSIPLTQFAKLTGMDRRRCHRHLSSLVIKNIVTKTVTKKGDKETIYYGIQKDYERWKVSPKKVTATRTVTQKGDRVSPKKVTKVSPLLVTSKENKRNSSKENKRICRNPLALELTQYLISRILAWKPDFKPPHNGHVQNWAIVIDRMIRLDHRTPDRIRDVIEFSTQDDFWQTNILSAKSLRDAFDRLEGQMRRKEKFI